MVNVEKIRNLDDRELLQMVYEYDMKVNTPFLTEEVITDAFIADAELRTRKVAERYI